MQSSETTSCEEIAYPGYPRIASTPDRLATLATLFGMKPAPVERCRVLELGCGDGANLIPMALDLTGSQFTGLDISPAQIGRAQTTAAAISLKNISFRQIDLLDFDVAAGEFDYIIAHGVYSWVPPVVRSPM